MQGAYDLKEPRRNLEFNERQVDLITIRQPLTGRYVRFFQSINKISKVNLITGTLTSTIYLKMKANTLLAYAIMFGKSIGKGPALLDAVAALCGFFRSRNDLVVDFRMPLAPQLVWLGHPRLASIIQRMEDLVQDGSLVIAPNEIMARMCQERGAVSVKIVPNYPTRDFKPTVGCRNWKVMHELDPDGHVALFTGGIWVREIYGLDMLLESWKLVENSVDADLVILGELPNDYIHKMIRSLNIRRLHLSGRVGLHDVANWVNCADVCLAPRTPGFPKRFYDDKDSTKISEYAALEKQIVAAGYAPSTQYLLVDQTPKAFAEGIMKGLDEKITPPKPHYWEENEPSMLTWLEDVWFG